VAISRCKSLNDIYFRNKKSREDKNKEKNLEEKEEEIKEEIDIMNKLQASSAVIEFFREHFFNEIRRLYSRRPDWFNQFIIKTDNNTIVTQQIYSIIEGIKIINTIKTITDNTNEDYHTVKHDTDIVTKELKKVLMPLILNNTQREQTNESRGTSQQVLRNWLLNNQRICAITKESISEILDAAHLRELSSFTGEEKEQAHHNNAILLRSDFHKLYDKGFISINTDGKILKVPEIQNHPVYSEFTEIDIPSFVNKEHLEWHTSNIFKGQ
jgi:hypothetical protein